MGKGTFFSIGTHGNRDGDAYLYSPIPVANRSVSCSFGFASLVGRCPTPRKGAALDLPGGPPPLDSHARLEKRRSLVMRCAMLFSFKSRLAHST